MMRNDAEVFACQSETKLKLADAQHLWEQYDKEFQFLQLSDVWSLKDAIDEVCLCFSRSLLSIFC